MPFSYATPGSGPSAGGIGWFNFQNLAINPGDSVTGLTGTLNNGVVVTFDMSLALVSGAPRTYVATQPPTFPGSSFGVDGYTGIVGNVAMYSNLQPLFGSAAFTINNIVVKDAGGNPISNYTVVIADAERTNLGESWVWNSNGGGWKLLAALGTLQPPLTGLGTQTATITGVGATTLGSYVLTTQAPTQLVLTTEDNDPTSRQGFAIGFATTSVSLQKNIGGRIDPSDQFVLNIAGTPSAQNTTAGAAAGLQPQIASVFATPDSPYVISESMAPGSASTLSQYTQIVSSMNATPGGSIPPTGNLPVTFTPALGDDVTYIILNAAPETFTKTVDKAFSDIGELLTYTVIINNPNNFAVSNVLMTDPTPMGTTYADNLTVSLPFTGTDPATGITITSIPANGSATISWQVSVNTAPPIPNPITNVATITVPGGTSGTTNPAITQVRHAAVSVMKSVDQAFAKPGDILTYTLLLGNMGNASANNVVISDPIPAGTTFVPGSVTGAVGTPPTLTLTNPIGVGGTATVTFKVLVGNLPLPLNPIPNTASANYTYTVNPANPNGASGTANSLTVNTQVSQAIVSVVKAAAPAAADLNGIITYTLNLQNTGNVPANNVTIADQVPSGTTFVPGSVTGATGTPPTLTLVNPIPAGGSAAVTFQVQVGNTLPSTNPIPNTASADYTYTVDPTNPNGAAGTTQSNTVTTPVNNASIVTTKTVDKVYAAPGDILTYTLKLLNTGNTDANNVIITDAVPTGTTFIAGSVTGATGTPPTLTLLNPITAGSTATVTFQVQVNPGTPVINPIPNSASAAFTYTVDPQNPNGATGGSSSNTVNTVVSFANVTSTKSVDHMFIQPGDVLTYTLTLQNSGNAAANNVVITDQIPAGTTFVPGSLTGATGVLPTLTLSAPIPAGGSSVVTFQVKAGSTIPASNPLLNSYTAAFTYTVNPQDPNGADGSTNSNVVSSRVNTAKVTIKKAVDKKIAYIGSIITYQLAVTNTGNTNADNVIITDLIPNGTAFVPGSLTVSVPHTGTPNTGIQLTNPIAPGQTVSISFQIKVTAIPIPNPIVNVGTAAYTYTVDPADPDGISAAAKSNPVTTVIFRNDYERPITDIITSVSKEQAALANIANEEGAKIQAAIAMSDISEEQLLCLNKSVADMIESITMLELVLRQKLDVLGCQIDSTDGNCL